MTYPPAPAAREEHVRYLRKDGRSVAVLRTVDQGDSCIVEAEVFPHSGGFPERPGPYTFADTHQAKAFMTDAVEALMYLGCDVAEE
jgi:hypothetical protein